MEMETLFEILSKGGLVTQILLGCSVVSVGVALERFWTIRRAEMQDAELLEHVRTLVRAGDLPKAVSFIENGSGCVARILRQGLLLHWQDRETNLEAMSRQKVREMLKLENRLGLLASLGSTAPYIGLFGTVLGIIRSFNGLSISTEAGAALVAAGIAEALIATAAGLAVAVPAVLAYNYFMTRIQKFESQIDLDISEVIELTTSRRGEIRGVSKAV